MTIIESIDRLLSWHDARGKWICSHAARCPKMACPGQVPHDREDTCESGCCPHGYPMVTDCIPVEEPAYMRQKTKVERSVV
jgi:hypothetical protein